jgi:hypothetical protein
MSAYFAIRAAFIALLTYTMPGSTTSSFAATIAHWQFDGAAAGTAAVGPATVLDSSANALHGTPFGSPVYQQAENSQALGFDGFTQYVFVPDSPEFQLTTALTIEAIARIDPLFLSMERREVVFRGDTRGVRDPYQLYVEQGRLGIDIDSNTQRRSLLTAKSLPRGEWLHVAGVYDGSLNVMRLYIDRELEASRTVDIQPLATLDPTLLPGIGIAARQDRAQLFMGLIDELRISDVALAPSEFLKADLPGDYNSNGTVDAADFVVWPNMSGQAGAGLDADGNGDGTVNAADYEVWRAHFGQTAAGGLSASSNELPAAVPEPSMLMLTPMAFVPLAWRRRIVRSTTRPPLLSYA